MNSLLLQRVAQYSLPTIGSMKFVVRKSFCGCRYLCTVIRGQRPLNYSRNCLQQIERMNIPVWRRQFSSSSSSFNLPSRTLAFFVLSSLGIVGGFYVISYSLRQTNIYKASLDIISRCPDVTAITGSPIESKGLAKGHTSSGVADMHFVVKGPKGDMTVAVTGTLREGSKTEYNLGTITAQRRSKDSETTVPIYVEGKLVANILDVVASEPDITENSEVDSTVAEEPKRYGFFLDKPWYYRVGLAAACGMVLGIVSSVMIMSFRKAPKSSSAYQSLLVLLKENKIAGDILGDGIKSVGKITGKSEESWANFSIKMEGKKSKALVNCQAFRQNDSWRFTVVSLDTNNGRVYLCK